jgi:predicted ester cyclase
MANEIVAVARRWFEEVWNQRRAETIDELLTPESVCHAEDGPITGLDEFRQRMYAPLLAAFPDIRVTIEDTLAEGSQAVVRWTATATHSGNGFGIGPTGKAVSFQGITWLRIVGGKLMEGWQQSNITETIRTLAEQTAETRAAS